jgi:hypothetical protein
VSGSQPPSREELAEHLRAARIAGAVATPRSSNLANITKMLDRAPDYWFGVELGRRWSFDEVLAVLAARVGIDPDPRRTDGPDRIDVATCLDRLDDAATLIAEVVAARGRLLFATGHPTGILALHLAVAAAAARHGASVLTPAAGTPVPELGLRARIRYLGGVAMLSNGADLLHTHAPEPMHHMLAGVDPRPDLVVADHGFAGAAAQAGLATVGFADSNDPALFVAAEEGRLPVVVPLDDNVAPAEYAPLADYLIHQIAG